METSVKLVMVLVRVIAVEKNAALVEWTGVDGYPYRGIVPVSEIIDGAVEQDSLVAAIPYGAAWEEMFTPAVTPAAMAGELRKANIWEPSDLYQPGGAARALAAIQAAYGFDLAALLIAAKETKGA